MGQTFSSQNEKLNLTSHIERGLGQNYSDYWKLLRIRFPYLIEEKFGIDMSYSISSFVPMNIIKTKLRHAVKEGDLEEIKNIIFSGEAKVDDPIDFYTCHTLLHEAVILNRPDLFQFLVKQGANLNLRDQNGYTPLLKAASIGRVEMCKALVESGVDPR